MRTLRSLLSMKIPLATIPIWRLYEDDGCVVDGGGVDVVFVSVRLYRVQFLLGDKTLSPNPFPSLCVIALIVAGPKIGPHVLVPCTIAADNFELHRVHERTVLLDSLPSMLLDHDFQCIAEFSTLLNVRGKR